MNSIFSGVFQNLYFWISVGAILAIVFAKLQQSSIENIADGDAQSMLSKTMLFSGIRILTSVGILFLAFKTGFANGLGCLIAFIIVRWISLFLLVKTINNTEKREV